MALLAEGPCMDWWSSEAMKGILKAHIVTVKVGMCRAGRSVVCLAAREKPQGTE